MYTMSTIDPEGLELQMLLKHLTFDKKRVLEIGCGEGRLTFKYATMTKDVIAIDPKTEEIHTARENIPSEFSSKIKFQIANGENLQFPDESFDIILYTYSLCCFPSLKSMKKALDEAWRVLIPRSIMVNIQASFHQPFEYNFGNIAYIVTRRPKTLVDPDSEEWIEKGYMSRSAIKEVTLIQHKFSLINEQTVTLNEYYETVDQLLEEKKEDLGFDSIEELSNKTRQEIQDMVESMRTSKGIRNQLNVVVSFLRKN